jgi:hypothetical protein
LPDDALFCHKCGKPQREIIEPEPVTQVDFTPQAAPPVAAVQRPLDFHNPVAVRIALMMSVCATLLSFVPFLNWVAAGFFAVFFYRRKTGSLLTVKAGVRLGWITGLLMFGFWAVLFTVQQIPAALNGRIGTIFQEQMKAFPASDPAVQQMLHFMQTGPGVAVMLVFSLAALFVFITGLSIAGGALGAKMVGRS